MRKIILSILILGFIGAGVGYYMYNKPVASLEKKKADVELSATQLIEDYEADETKANSIYLGKILQVSGKIADITDEEGKKKVQLETSNPISMIICELEDGTTADLLKAGEEVVLKGLCTGYLSDVILVQSTIVK